MGLTKATEKVISDNLSISGIATATNFKTGSTNVHSVGVEAAGINVLGADTPIGTGSTIYDDGGARFSGVVTATSFHGDGSGLEGVSSSGIGTPLSDDDTSTLNKAYYVNQELSIGSTVTVNHPSSAVASYTHYQDIVVTDDADFIVADGDTFIPDVLGINTSTLPNAVSSATGGRIRAGTITNAGANGAPNFPNGVTGTAATFTNTSTIAGIVTVTSGGVDTVGVITATTFKGDGSQLSNVTSTTINNNADNRIITGSGTANTLNGETNLTFNGTNLLTVHVPSATGEPAINFTNSDTGTGTSNGFGIGINDAESPYIYNRENTDIRIATNNTERFRIGSSGQFGIGGATYGTAGQVLTSGGASAAPTWGGAGKVLQVQYKRGGVTTSSNSGGWTDSVESGLNVDITPTSSTSFIIVQMHSVGGNTSSGRSFFLRLRRKINNTGDTNVASFQIGDGNNGGIQSLALTHVEVPNNWNTSHVINYRIRFGQDGSGTARFDYATTSVLYAMEVQP